MSSPPGSLTARLAATDGRLRVLDVLWRVRRRREYLVASLPPLGDESAHRRTTTVKPALVARLLEDPPAE